MKKLIRQIRSLGSPLKKRGVHVSLKMRKPNVFFKAPTYLIGGSNYSFTRQGGFISMIGGFLPSIAIKVRQTFTMEIMFLRENINKIKRFEYRLALLSCKMDMSRNFFRHSFPLTS